MSPITPRRRMVRLRRWRRPGQASGWSPQLPSPPRLRLPHPVSPDLACVTELAIMHGIHIRQLLNPNKKSISAVPNFSFAPL